MIDNSATLVNQLRATLGKMEVALGAIVEAIAWTDNDGKLHWSNTTFDRLVNRQRFKVLGESLFDLLPLDQQGQEISRELHPLSMVLKGQSNITGVYEFQQTDQRLVLEISLTRIQFQGQQTSAVVVIRDITERKLAELALTQTKADLEIRVKERTAELQNAVAQLEQAEAEISKALEKEKELNELKSRFISMASHEFRTPLATILTSSDLLKSFGQNFNEEKKLKYLNKIQSQVKKMTQLLEDVLFISKTEVKKVKLKTSKFDLEAFCREILEEIELINNTNHIFNFTCEKDCSQVEMDEKLLHQILTNLIFNAVKYSAKGSSIKFNLSCEKGYATFTIKDEGIGIPVSDQEHLFEAFHRCSNVGTISGTGLGLLIIKNAVELHGGTINVESEVGVGTTFTICLPTSQVKD